MPVSFGMRDEENERINNILKKLMSLVFIPDGPGEQEFTAELKRLSLTQEVLLEIPDAEVIQYLERYHFDWANMEQFADLLAILSKRQGFNTLKQKALAVYNHIQAESRMFSFDIFNKINSLSN